VVDEFQARIEELRARKEKNLQMGGPKKVVRQHARGKLHVRERLDGPGASTATFFV
jgi:acetyl-CoA carboxylase carboxyltransferase component